MTERYYHAEHRDAYARIRSNGLDQWNDLHDRRRSYHDFPSRPFLTRSLPARGDGQRALVYGCGTGGAACYLAEAGFVVDAVDLVPDAIEIARARADEHGLDIRFEVADVCRWGAARDRFDVVLDDFCLQSIVTDEDRKRLY
ncbi:MAG TPA: class I SAM-dependent methyltransferase, partial [Microlunatus sp.]